MTTATRYKDAIWRPSTIPHPMRTDTLGTAEHWTAGREPGDLITLDGPNVDCHFYVTKRGEVYQFLDLMSQAWHAFFMANHYCVGIEHEGSGEPWTANQLHSTARLNAWICSELGIPIRHVDPSGHDVDTFRGLFGHRDLSLGGIRVDGNNHTDSVPDGTGWPRFLSAVRLEAKGECKANGCNPKPNFPNLSKFPHPGALRLVVGGRKFSGPEDCYGPMRWIVENPLKSDECAVSFWGPEADHAAVWRGAVPVRNVVKNIYRRYMD